jgi:hypothetical protein
MKKLSVALILMMFAFFACEGKKGPAGPQGPTGPAGTSKIYVSGECYETGEVVVLIEFSPEIPRVTVNQDTLPIVDYSYSDWEGVGFTFDGHIPVSVGGSANLKAVYSKGVATASVKVPGNFHITSPDTSHAAQIHVGLPFTVSWSASANADFYWVDFELGYSYYDTSGHYKSFYIDRGVSKTSTSITFPASELFPSDIDYLYDSCGCNGGYFDVQAMNGPKIESGSEGNVTGDGIGFFWASFYGGSLEIEIEGTAYSSSLKARKGTSREEVIKRHIEKAKELDPNYQALKKRWVN